MARKKKSSIKGLLDVFEPQIRDAFLAALQDVRDNIQLGEVIAALKNQDVNGAIAALNLSPAAFNDFQDTLTRSYAAGGHAGVASMPPLRDPQGASAILRFNVRDLDAERYIRNYSSTKVVNITEEARESARIFLEQGLVKGDNPVTTARDLAGRVNPKTGRRENGVIDLTPNQTKQLLNARTQLAEDPAAYLKRKGRDKRYDKTIRKAMAQGKAVPADTQRKAFIGVENAMLKARANAVARTESMSTLHAGQRQAFDQAIDQGLAQPDEIEREWDSAGDNKVRESHRDLDGTIVGWEEPYVLEDGTQLMFPGDPNGPADEVINCRCNEIIRINYLNRLRST